MNDRGGLPWSCHQRDVFDGLELLKAGSHDGTFVLSLNQSGEILFLLVFLRGSNVTDETAAATILEKTIDGVGKIAPLFDSPKLGWGGVTLKEDI